jgi:hypothetical protein
MHIRPMGANRRRLIAVLLAVCYVVTAVPARAWDGDDIDTETDKKRRGIGTTDEPVTVEIGHPSVWSLSQAHYLLANMHLRDRGLKVELPTAEALDPNRANAYRLEILKSLLAIEGQYNQAMGVRNEMKQQQYRRALRERKNANARIADRQRARDELSAEIRETSLEIARLEELNRQAEKARLAEDPPNETPSAEESARSLKITELKTRLGLKTARRDEIDEELAGLHTEATADVSPPEFEVPSLEMAPTAKLADPSAMTKFVEQALADFDKPSMAASTALDNFIGMQYEIIAKQLTLLRDEVGPNERVIFLELPASIYTVDKRANDYLAQVEWKVEAIYDKELEGEARKKAVKEWLASEGYKDLDVAYEQFKNDPIPVTLDLIDSKRHVAVESKLNEETSPSSEAQGNPPTEADTGGLRGLQVRTLDVIPRQSALNVNEYQAVSKQRMFLAAFKFLIGFAGGVNYQRQREQYQQFLQQEIFASGYGKGDAVWGWVYGSTPGSRRIAPGVRTAYAVLAVPRNALALKLVAKGRAFKRQEEPGDADDDQKSKAVYYISIPSERTDQFWVSGVNYTPVRKGNWATVLINGRGFSPQLGVMINGVALSPRVSIAGRAIEEFSPLAQTGPIKGHFEVLNSGQIILNFTMGSDYVGTPDITFVSPEKTSSINAFKVTVNYRKDYGPRSLKSASITEPIFMDDFSITDVAVVPDAAAEGFVTVRLRGTGLRPDASVWVGDKRIGSKRQLFLGDYGDADADPGRSEQNNAKTIVDKNHPNLGAGHDERAAFIVSAATRSTDVDAPAFDQALRKDIEQFIDAAPALKKNEFVDQESTISYVVRFKSDKNPDEWVLRYRQSTRQGFDERELKIPNAKAPSVTVASYKPGAKGDAKVVLLVRLDEVKDPVLEDGEGECVCPVEGSKGQFRVTMSVKADDGVERSKITLRPLGVESTLRIPIKLPIRPEVHMVRNPSNDKPSGAFDQELDVVIKGSNLQNVSQVFFGNKEGTIVAGDVRDVLVVRTPKADVPAGESLTVPVRLLTKTSVDGKPVTNAADFSANDAYYTFVGPPKPPKKETDKSIVVVVPKQYEIVEPKNP